MQERAEREEEASSGASDEPAETAERGGEHRDERSHLREVQRDRARHGVTTPRCRPR